MSIEQKLQELQALAEQLEEAKCMKKESEAEDEKEDEPEGEDGESDIENDDEAEGAESEEDEGKKPVPEKAKVKSVKESKVDLGDLFAGQELSEEFKAKAAAVFEAAVSVRVQQEVAELQESFAQKQLNEAAELKESLVDKVDGYLDYMVEQWMEKNELAINRGVKTEILESFVSGMKSLFETHYIDVPDEKYDLVEQSQAEVQELEARLDEQAEQLVGMRQQIREMTRQRQIDEACVDLADTDAERFRQLAEELAFGGENEFRGKLQSILETYFQAAPAAAPVLKEEFMTDEPVQQIVEEVKPAVDPTMAAYLRAIEKSGF